MKPVPWITLTLALAASACVAPATPRVASKPAAVTPKVASPRPASPSPAAPSPSPSPSPTPSPNYFPLSKGAVWEYQATREGQPCGSMRQEVTAVASKDGLVTATLTTAVDLVIDGAPAKRNQTLTYRKTADEVTYDDEQGSRFIEFKVPIQPKASWKTQGLDVVVEGVETLLLPYKLGFDAYKLVGTTPQGLRITNWYADGIGFVKAEGPGPGGATVVYELKAYTPGSPVY